MLDEEHPRYGHAAWALGLLTALNLCNFIDRYVLPGVQPLIQHDFHSSDERMGALTSAFFLTYMLAAPLTGWLGDRVPRKPLVVAGAVLWSVATLLTATVHSYEQLYFRHAVVGIGEATFSVFAPAMIADMYPERIRNKALSIFYLSIPVGAALGYLIAGQLGSAYGWRMPFLVSAAPGVIIAVLILFFVREPVRGSADRLQATPTRSTILGVFTNPAYWTATLGMAMMVFTMGGISVWLPTFLSRVEGYSLSRANQILGRRDGNRRHRGNHCWRLDRAALAADQPSCAVPGLCMERCVDVSCCSDGLLRTAIAACAFDPAGGVLSLPQHRTVEYGDRQLRLRAGAFLCDSPQSLPDPRAGRLSVTAAHWRCL